MTRLDSPDLLESIDGKDTTEEEPRQLSLMAGFSDPRAEQAATDLEYGGFGRGNKLLSQTTLLILLVAVVAAGSIYAMRLGQGDLSGGQALADIDLKINQALKRLSLPNAAEKDPIAAHNIDTLFKDTESIVKMFDTDVTQKQVPLEYVKKNPFRLPMAPRPVVAQAALPVAQSAEDRAALRVKELDEELKKLELRTIVQGQVPVAVINDRIVQINQKVGSFVVTNISGLVVDMEAEGRKFQLRMKTSEDGKSGGKAAGLGATKIPPGRK